MAGNDDSEGPGILVVSLKGDQRPVDEHSGPQARPRGAAPSPFPASSGSQAPFGGGEDPNAAIFGQGAPAPAPAAPAVPSLELDEPAQPSAPKKKIRPELAEWSQSLSTGEHPAMPGAPAGPAFPSAASSGAHELGRPPGGRGKAAGAIVVLAALGGLGFGVWKMTSGPTSATLQGGASDNAATGEPGAAASGFFLRPENAPDCWTTDEGFHFVYKASSGAEKAASTIAEVPVLYRITARCVRD